MSKWSYQIENFVIVDCVGRYDMLEDKLSEWGAKGGELVYMTEKEGPHNRGQQRHWIYTCAFKWRTIEETTDKGAELAIGPYPWRLCRTCGYLNKDVIWCMDANLAYPGCHSDKRHHPAPSEVPA